MHKLVLDTFLEVDYKLIGINASIEAFKMAFLINKNLNMRLKRTKEDVEMQIKKQKAYFALYHYKDTKNASDIFFVQNKTKYIDQSPKFVASLFNNQEQSIGKHLINSHKQTDYFLKIEDEFNRFKIKKLINELNDIPQIISAYEIYSEDIKSPENLIFE